MLPFFVPGLHVTGARLAVLRTPRAWWVGAGVLLGLLAVGSLASLAFFAVVPRRGGRFATAGRWTLVVYLIHGFVVKGIGYTGFGDRADTHGLLALLATTVLGVAVALTLAWDPLARRLNVLVDPYGSVLRLRARRLAENDCAELSLLRVVRWSRRARCPCERART